MEEASSDEEEEARRPTLLAPRLNPAPATLPISQSQPPPLPPAPDKVLVKKGYDPKQGTQIFCIFIKLYSTLVHFYCKVVSYMNSQS